MKTSKDNLLMTTLIAAMVTFAAAGAIETTSAVPADISAGPLAAVRPASTDVPAVVVTAPRVTRIG
ncbi:MAG: hypothetical protein JNK75_01545 [Betaproteobacteria bacterium]|nr:hypothetical protein [Betaproteobacteria bacterium]